MPGSGPATAPDLDKSGSEWNAAGSILGAQLRTGSGAPAPQTRLDSHAVKTVEPKRRQRGDSTEHVIEHVRQLIGRGDLRPGDRLPAERDLAAQLGVSRPTIRAGLLALAAMGVIQSRHGSGTYIPDGPPRLDSEPLSFLAALHGFTREEM